MSLDQSKYKLSGEIRAPKKGEYYVSPSTKMVTRANVDFSTSELPIAVPIDTPEPVLASGWVDGAPVEDGLYAIRYDKPDSCCVRRFVNGQRFYITGERETSCFIVRHFRLPELPAPAPLPKLVPASGWVDGKLSLNTTHLFEFCHDGKLVLVHCDGSCNYTDGEHAGTCESKHSFRFIPKPAPLPELPRVFRAKYKGKDVVGTVRDNWEFPFEVRGVGMALTESELTDIRYFEVKE